MSEIDVGFFALADPAASQLSGGRGGARKVSTPIGPCVIRPSRRGGLVARFVTNNYLYLGADRTRVFREWRLLAHLWERDYPVPRPVAAHFKRTSPISYTATLVTQWIDGTATLAQSLASATNAQWREIGESIASFHEAGACHADLNAHNVLLGGERGVYLVDFDRGRLRPQGAWKERSLARLRRSVAKLTADSTFPELGWAALLRGYAETG